jgi:hypothetical protein
VLAEVDGKEHEPDGLVCSACTHVQDRRTLRVEQVARRIGAGRVDGPLEEDIGVLKPPDARQHLHGEGLTGGDGGDAGQGPAAGVERC